MLAPDDNEGDVKKWRTLWRWHEDAEPPSPTTCPTGTERGIHCAKSSKISKWSGFITSFCTGAIPVQVSILATAIKMGNKIQNSGNVIA